MTDADDPKTHPEQPALRRLRLLVTTLMVTLIIGFVIIVATLVIRLTATPPPFVLPDDITLPAGETASAVTFGDGWIAVVTTDTEGAQKIRILNRLTGEPVTQVPIPQSR